MGEFYVRHWTTASMGLQFNNIFSTTTTGAYPSRRRENTNRTNNTGDCAMFLFEKRYDAYKTSEQRNNPIDIPTMPTDENEPKYLLRNSLSGTCQWSQLLLQGYEQELTNGKNFVPREWIELASLIIFMELFVVLIFCYDDYLLWWVRLSLIGCMFF